VIDRAIDDWNLLFRESFGVEPFSRRTAKGRAAIKLSIRPSTSGKLMGATELEVANDGIIRLPVKISLSSPEARGQTPAEVVFHQVAAHELGHALSAFRTAQIHDRSCVACAEASTSPTQQSEPHTSTPGNIRLFTDKHLAAVVLLHKLRLTFVGGARSALLLATDPEDEARTGPGTAEIESLHEA